MPPTEMLKFLPFFVSFLLLPVISYSQSCQFKDEVYTCHHKNVQVLREPGNSVKDVEVYLDVEEKNSDLTVFLTLDVGSNSWNFQGVNQAYGTAEGTNYLFSAKRVKTNTLSHEGDDNLLYLERVVVVLQNDRYIENVVNGRTFVLKVNGLSFNLKHVVKDIKKAESFYQNSS